MSLQCRTVVIPGQTVRGRGKAQVMRGDFISSVDMYELKEHTMHTMKQWTDNQTL